MEFRLGNGPWQTVFSGELQGHELEILENPESLLMVAIYETGQAKKTGVLLECFQVFFAEGEIESLIEKTKTPALLLLHHDGGETLKFFLLGGAPGYAAVSEDDVHAETNALMKTLENNSRIVRGIALSSDVTLTPLHAADERVQKAFLSQPLGLAALAAGTARGRGASAGIEKISVESRPTSGAVILGVNKQNELVSEPLALFETTLVEGGKTEERRHVVKVVVESALLSQATAIVFDTEKAFNSLGMPGTADRKLREFGVASDPVGFPLKVFSVPDATHVSLSTLTAGDVAELFGFGPATAQALKTLLAEKDQSTIAGLILNRVPEKSRENEQRFEELRAIRILNVLDAEYPGLFDGKNRVEELATGGVGGLGRAAIVDCSAADRSTLLLIVKSLLQEIAAQFEGQRQRQLRILLVFPQAERLFPVRPDMGIARDIVEVLWKLKEYGVGFVVASEKESLLHPNIRKLPEALLTIVSGTDVSVQLKGKRNYRVKIRPTLSRE